MPVVCSRRMRYSITDRVRWSDVDRAGIIYFGSYVRFFEIAETELFRAIGLPFSNGFEIMDCYTVRAQFHCDFRLPAYLDDLLEVKLWVSQLGGSSLKLRFDIIRQESVTGKPGELLVEGNCTLVSVDREKYRPKRLPAILTDALTPYCEIEEPNNEPETSDVPPLRTN